MITTTQRATIPPAVCTGQQDADTMRDDLAAFKEDLVLYEANGLDNLAAWTRLKIAELERQLGTVQP